MRQSKNFCRCSLNFRRFTVLLLIVLSAFLATSWYLFRFKGQKSTFNIFAMWNMYSYASTYHRQWALKGQKQDGSFVEVDLNRFFIYIKQGAYHRHEVGILLRSAYSGKAFFKHMCNQYNDSLPPDEKLKSLTLREYQWPRVLGERVHLKNVPEDQVKEIIISYNIPCIN